MFSNARKQAEQTAHQMIAGHCTLIAWWTLRHAGVFDAMDLQWEKEGTGLDPLVHATRTSMSPDVLQALLDYLSGVGLLHLEKGLVRLSAEGRALYEHGDSVLEMVRAYEGVLEMTEHLLAKLKTVAGGGRKSDGLIASQAKRFAEEVFPALREIVAAEKCDHLLDIACGTGDLLIHLAQKIRQVVGVGIGTDPQSVRRANAAIAQADLEKRLIAVTANPHDVFTETQRTFERIGVSRQLWNNLDCVIATQVFSEAAAVGGEAGQAGEAAAEENVIQALVGARRHFSKSKLLVIEPIVSEKFARNFYAPELALLLKLTRCEPWEKSRWRDLFAATKWKVRDERELVTDGLAVFVCVAEK